MSEIKKEIRKVVQGEKGLLLAKTEYAQKFHIVTKDSKAQPGDFVEANVVRNEEKCALYKCVAIPKDRMVLEIVTPRGCSDSAVYHWNGVEESAGYFRTAEIELHIEESTGHSSVHNYRGGDFGGYRRLALIKEGAERTVLGVFVKSQFRYFVLEGMGIWNLHANGSGFQYRKDLKTREDFENAWRQYDHGGFSKHMGTFGPWVPGLEGTRPLESSRTEWDILVPHLAAWSQFASKIEALKMCVGSECPEELRPYGFTAGWGANHYACLNPLLDKATEFFTSVADITKERVIEFFAQTESIFPEVPEPVA